MDINQLIVDTDGDLETIATPSKSTAVDKDRITAKITMHHEHCCDTPTSIETGFSEFLESKVTPYNRIVQLKEDSWRGLAVDWIEEEGGQVGYVAIFNKRQRLMTNPSDEEKKLIKEKNILISLRSDETVDIEVGYGKFCVLTPKQARSLKLKSARGVLEAQIVLFPR